MISPDRFYSSDDRLTPEAKRRMWKNIKPGINLRQSSILLAIPDKRSFFYGIAAAILIFFVATGIISTLRSSLERSQPQAVKLDAAYITAIKEFEKVMPDIIVPKSDSATTPGLISVRMEELKNIDAAIYHMRADVINGDLSPLRQKRLRQLYSMKLSILQDMVENGDITL